MRLELTFAYDSNPASVQGAAGAFVDEVWKAKRESVFTFHNSGDYWQLVWHKEPMTRKLKYRLRKAVRLLNSVSVLEVVLP